MTGVVTDLAVAGRLAMRSIGRRMRSAIQSPPDLEAFTLDMQSLLDAAPADTVQEFRWLKMPGDQPPWVSCGMQVAEGDELSYFIEGRVYANRFLDIYLGPAQQLWCRVGDDGEIFRGTRASHSFRTATGGALQFGNYFPNDWADSRGARKQSDDVYQTTSGECQILVIRWSGSALDGLRALARGGDPGGRLAGEIERMAQGDTTPAGWHYLWHLGPAEIYRHRDQPGGGACIHCATHGDVGILQKDVDLPLDEGTEISWRWCVGELPSTLREDSVPSHDYLSIAVEFDDGRDITYYWSSSLPVGTGYDCPLPNWQGKEFHVVVRSGRDGLGQWRSERRNLYADYRRYMGAPPARVVRVWLIANSIFQRGHGRCDYADILLHRGDEALRVL